MKQDDWTNKLSDRLEDYEEPVGEELWTRIEAQLDAKRRRTAGGWLWRAAAAVAGVMLVGGSLLWWDYSHDGTTMPEQTVGPVTANVAKTVDTPTPETVSPLIAQATPIATRPPRASSKATTSEPLSEVDATTPTDTPPTAEQPATTAHEPESQPQGDRRQTTTRPAPVRTPPVSERRTAHRLTASVYASNGFDGQRRTDRVMMSPERMQMFASEGDNNAVRAAAPVWLTDYEERAHHSSPVAIGLRVSYPLGSRLSVSTGMVYTLLQSDFTNIMRGQPIEREQTLHYIGLPAALHYRLWQTRRLQVYATADVEADWNVKARQTANHTSTDMAKDRCQWSFGGSLGVAVDLTRHLSLYAEPGIRHYPDNHSDVANYFKDRPTTFSLQVGLQLSIGDDR